MVPLLQRVTTLKGQAESLPGRAPAYPVGSTGRGVEVLQLVTSGKAEELFISFMTVTTHVRNILNKIGADNRVEATAYAIRQGLA